MRMDLNVARRERDSGMAMVEQAAINANPKWPDVALEYLKLYAIRAGANRFTAEDVLAQAVIDRIIEPPNPKAWGGPFKRAATLGIIRKVGYDVCHKRHASPTILWESVR